MSQYKSLQEECYEANMRLNTLGLVIFTFGNVSAVDRDKAIFAIKPSGVPYEILKPEDIVIMDYDAKVVDGKMRPSSDTKTHAQLYKTWDELPPVFVTSAETGDGKDELLEYISEVNHSFKANKNS